MSNTIAEVMTKGVQVLTPDDDVQAAARLMDEMNVGAVPIVDAGRLVGIVTDRDIVVRAVALDRPASRTRLRDVMSAHVRHCTEEQPVDDVLAMMREAQIRRIPVLDRGGRPCGIVSLGDLATKSDRRDAGDALSSISEPAAPDRPDGGGSGGAPVPMPPTD